MYRAYRWLVDKWKLRVAYHKFMSANDPLAQAKSGDELIRAVFGPVAIRSAPLSLDRFQFGVLNWSIACFRESVVMDKVERNHRFLEEAIELVQACGAGRAECHELVDYVYGRPVGEAGQEVGGVMLTLAALCNANDLDLSSCSEAELARVWQNIEKIRAKQAAKPKGSPLPE